MTENSHQEIEKTVAYGIALNLKAHGVKHIFGIPDGHTLAFYDALYHTAEIKHILVNDERTAAFAADAYGRVTGMLGVCDSGPAGSMNFPVGISEARGSTSPVLAIVSTVKSADILRNVPHDINISDVLKPITKWSENVTHGMNAPRFLDYAIRQAVNGLPGPVALVFPEDVLKSTDITLSHFIPLEKGSCSINGCRISAAQNEIQQAVEMIQKAKMPCIFSGGGTILSGAYAEVEKFSEILQAPVFSTISGKGIMIQKDDFSNNYFGTIGLFGERPNHNYLKKSVDLVIVIGNKLTEDDTAYFKFPPQEIPMIHIDLDPSEIGLSYRALGVVGDPQDVLIHIIKELQNKGVYSGTDYDQVMNQRKLNLQSLREAQIKHKQKDEKTWINSEPIKPQRILKAISDVMGPEDYLITDASSSSRWIGPYFPVKGLGRKIITPRGVGPTGFGVGALIGTHFALESMYPKESMPKIILFTGDGGLMNGGLSDFETILKYKIDCTIVILNNASLGFVKYGQALLYQWRYYDTDRPDTDFAKIANGFGARGKIIKTIKELEDELKFSTTHPGFHVLDVKADPKELLPINYY